MFIISKCSDDGRQILDGLGQFARTGFELSMRVSKGLVASRMAKATPLATVSSI
ncbi:hypothetical protein [Paracoccus rhizosphaerae]|uniref:Uncharacterized protein n=1 Tax=Paracoccus rhizosphaerae TaxID=1133347 RepID=A0ABV6CL55_9RHOB|nr:hypothetical protein [Paracoccus rhizosphaerae]